MGIITGWTGRFYEDFHIGDIYQHSIGRTITEMDEVWFSGFTFNTHQQHFNKDYSGRVTGGKTPVSIPFIVALITGLSASDTSRNGINLEWIEIKAPNPLYVGETVYADSEVLEKRESKSKPAQGIIKIKSRGITETGKVVLEFTRSIMVYKAEFAPQTDLFPKVSEVVS